MKFCIYQINLDRDTDRVAFEDLENLQRYHGGRVIRSDLYDKIYEGDFPCSSLEDLFHIFNVEHPADYPGRSMSVSDVVEIIDSPKLVGVIETEFRVERYTDFEDRDLHDQAFDQRFIKFCDDGGLLPDEILQVLDQAHLDDFEEDEGS